MSEQKIHSTQKPVETQYVESEFWNRVELFTLKRAELPNRTIATATRNLVWGLLTNKDKSAVLTLAARLACYIKVHNSSETNMLEIETIAQETTVPPVVTPTTPATESEPSVQTDATPLALSTSSNINTLEDPKWYDGVEIHENSYKAKIKTRLIKATDNNLCIWGPWFALLLVRLEKRSNDHFLNKLVTLNSNLTKLYTISQWEPLSLDSLTELKGFLEGYNGLNLNDNLKFTLYNSLIKKYNNPSSTHMEKGMLNFTTLQSLRYNGLNLLTLVDQIKKLYNVSLSQLIEPLGTAETVVSWKEYMKF